MRSFIHLREHFVRMVIVSAAVLIMTVMTLSPAIAATGAAPGSAGSGGSLESGIYIPCLLSDMDLYDAFSSASGKQVCVSGSFGEVFNLTVGGGNISGTGTGSTGCTFTVTGTYSGKTFNMTMNQTQSASCCDYWTVSGTVNLKAKTATGNWVNSPDCGGTGSMGFTLCS